MQTHEFLGQVQHKARLASLDHAIRATRAALETLAERLGADEASHLGAQLPREIGHFLVDTWVVAPERFSSDEYLQRVSEREGVDLPSSVYHTRVVFEVLQDAVSPGEIDDVLDRLPNDFRRLFAGSQDQMPQA